MHLIKKLLFTVILAYVGLQLAACTPASQALKPVAQQNQQNLAELANNIRVVLELYEPLLESNGEALIKQHIGKTRQEMFAVTGINFFPSPTDTWDSLFNMMPDHSLEKYKQRYQYIKAALERGLNAEESQQLKLKEGWIFTALADEDFTPQKARDLLDELTVAQHKKHFYSEAEALLTPYDPILELRRNAITSAKSLLEGLKKQINQQLATASIHAQSITNFAKTKTNLQQTINTAVADVDVAQLETTLDKLSQKYLDNPSYKDAAIDLMITGVQKLIESQFSGSE
ncbi:hypothetical protein [Candidatus Albibeggiatoa sp. nov. NOAA]|uniref:hypothetical protein n=1 Tax=Candidatus Albibeggiatoa sp. nov. NOAA TaxID=3162724 RepID=UPI0032F4C145|nr:hypothetical protein [Thiotrichaceae bacterium]